jgi:hypothetical protein
MTTPAAPKCCDDVVKMKCLKACLIKLLAFLKFSLHVAVVQYNIDKKQLARRHRFLRHYQYANVLLMLVKVKVYFPCGQTCKVELLKS